MKRFGRTLIGAHSAEAHAFAAHIAGADAAPLYGDCKTPVRIHVTGLRDPKLAQLNWLAYETEFPGIDYAPGHGWLGMAPEKSLDDFGTVRNIDLEVRCRKCATCLRARAAHWRARAYNEIQEASRTWFGTLTLSPEAQFHCVAAASQHLAAMGIDLGSLEPSDKFRETCKPLTRECQLWLKRLRKRAGGLRYALVVERHKSGLPHCHVLVHETLQPVRHRHLTAAWQWGFSSFKLVEADESQQAAAYVAKYLAKSAETRIKASIRYGRNETMGSPVSPSLTHKGL